MSLTLITPSGSDFLHPVEGWGDVPEADRPLWSRYMVEYLPWFPGITSMRYMAGGVMNGNTRAPKLWKETAQELHAAGFTPADYYLLSALLELESDLLDEERHAKLFIEWPKQITRRTRRFRLAVDQWVPWLEQVRAGESPADALEKILQGDKLKPIGTPPSLGEGPSITS